MKSEGVETKELNAMVIIVKLKSTKEMSQRYCATHQGMSQIR